MSNFFKSFSTFSFFTIISRLLGFIRDVVNARVLGAGMLSDVFFVAFRLPNLFRSIFAEGAMNSAFIPLYSKKISNNEEDISQFIGKIIFLIGIFLIFFCGLAEIYMPAILNLIAPGLQENNEYFDVAIKLSRIMFPFLFFITITAIYSCILNSHNKFMPGAAYPIIMNVILIIASITSTLAVPAYSLSYGVILSGFLQMVFLIGMTRYYRVKVSIPKFNLDFFNYDIKHFFRKLIPSIMTSCVTRIGITIDTIIASNTVGAVSYIYYADRLYQLPLAIIGVALSTTLLPSLSKLTVRLAHYKDQNNHEEYKKLIEKLELIQSRIVEFAMILILPSTIGLYFLAEDISGVIFGINNNKFGIEEISNTGIFLSILCFALPANILSTIFNSVLFANHITKFTTKIAVYTLALNLLINFTLYYKYNIGFISIAIATVISSYFNTISLAIFCRKMNFVFRLKDFLRIRYIFFANMFIAIMMEIINMTKDFMFIRFSWQWNIVLFLEILVIINTYFLILNYKNKFTLNDFKKLFID